MELKEKMQDALKKQLPKDGQVYVNHAAAVCAEIALKHFEEMLFELRMEFEMEETARLEEIGAWTEDHDEQGP